MAVRFPNLPIYCKLCGSPEQLCDSHIIPDFYIRALEARIATGTKGQMQPTSILLSTRAEIEGGQRQRGIWENRVGMKEKLLCLKCENKLSKHERYFRNFFYGTNTGAGPYIKKTPLEILTYSLI